MPIQIEKVILHRLEMELINPFTTNLGYFQTKDFFIVEVIDKDGYRGYGETVAFPTPWYTEETVETSLHILEKFLIPLLLQKEISHPDEVANLFNRVRRNNMAKAAVEGAIWDLFAKRNNLPLAKAIGGKKSAIDVGVSIGIQSSIKDLLNVIEKHASEGYKRVKIKVKPGWDLEVLKEVRTHFPNLPIMVDANSAYKLSDIDHLKKFDEFQLMMMEQPLAHDDFLEHAKLQAQMETPICLDESIHTLNDAKVAIELDSCKIINIKPGRVGGITVAKQIHDYCKEHQVPVWCGGMLEAGIGRAQSIAVASLPQFTLPADLSASSRYWKKDIIEPEVTMKDGQIQISDRPGIGYEIDWKTVESYRTDKRIYEKQGRE